MTENVDVHLWKTLFVDTGVDAHIDQDVAYFKMKTAQSYEQYPRNKC